VIFWAGKSSDDVNTFVEHYPSQIRPAKKYNKTSVPGRNGDLIFEEGTFENYIQPYEIYISAEKTKLPKAAKAVAEWLYAPKGYQKLEDSYDPDVFRMAFFSGPADIENILNIFGRATVEFDCKPQRFLISGQEATRYYSATTITNPTAFEALPLITVYGNGAGALNVGGTVVNFSSIDESIELDCETENAYKGVTNLNNTITAPSFPKLLAGKNEITWSGGIESIRITPRWWTL
jgi:phage-related protein